MSKFREWVREFIGKGVPDGILNILVENYEQTGRGRRDYVEECANLAKRLYVSQQTEDGSGALLSPTPELLLDCDRMIADIRPQVEQIRHQLFGSPAPPFASIDEAAEWIEQMAAEKPSLSPAQEEEVDRLQRLILEQGANLRNILDVDVHLSLKSPVLPFIKAGSELVEKVAVGRNSPLGKLERVVRELAQRTGFPPAGITTLILIDMPPLLPLARITQTRFGIGRQSLTIALHARRITYLQFRNIYAKLNQQGRGWSEKTLTSEHLKLLTLVKQMGEEPKEWGEKRIFWEKVQKSWTQSGDKNKRKITWRALEMRYHRLLRKQKRMHSQPTKEKEPPHGKKGR